MNPNRDLNPEASVYKPDTLTVKTTLSGSCYICFIILINLPAGFCVGDTNLFAMECLQKNAFLLKQ